MRRWFPRLVAALGGLLVLAGVVVFALANRPREVIYEGSYAPSKRSRVQTEAP